MEHGRHLERERAWLLNFYMIVLGAFINGLLRGKFSKEVLKLVSIILAGFSFIALATTLKLNAEYSNIINTVKCYLHISHLPVIGNKIYRYLFECGPWISAFYEAMAYLFLKPSSWLHLSWGLISFTFISGAVAYCLSQAITRHIDLSYSCNRDERKRLKEWHICSILSLAFAILLIVLSLTYLA